MNLSHLEWGKSNFWYWRDFKTFWQVIGDLENPPLVLIHGFGASSFHWRRNALDFAKAGFCVYGIDLIGFGKSEQPSSLQVSRLDNEFWAKQLIAFLEEIVINSYHQKVVLIGNSLGSLVGLTSLRLRNELISALVAAPLPDPAFMSSFKFSYNKYFRKIKYYFSKVFFKLLPLELIVPFISYTKIINIALEFAYNKSIKEDKDLREIVTVPARRKTASRALRAMCFGMTTRAINMTAPNLLKSLTFSKDRVPILLVWGREDKLIPFSVAKTIVKSNSWLDLLVIEDTGHCPHDESFQEFNKNVIQWLKSNLGESF